MAGLLLVFLTIFNTNEGYKLDKLLEDGRCGAYIHLLEILLMLESLCKEECIDKNDLYNIKYGMPYIMETIKTVLNRQVGCGMKIIKFHLLIHYAEDICRFGSMRNFDSAIGERHHCTEVKNPAKNTQRRKNNFELQTATRYCENIAITKAYNDINSNCSTNLNKQYSDIFNNTKKDNIEENQNKHVNIMYVHEDRNLMINNYKTKKLETYVMNDNNLRNEIIELCSNLVENGYVNSPIKLFTQHNRDGNIFRADSAWKNETWYDWANVKWGAKEIIPAQLLIFMDLNNNFIKPFKVGQCKIVETGSYAIGRTFQSSKLMPAHQQSKLIGYGQLAISDKTKKPELFMFPVDSIHSTCLAVPFRCNEDPTNAMEWLIIKPKLDWYKIFVDIVKSI